MYCPIKVDRNTIELTVYTSCYCVLDLLCVSCITFYGCRCQLTLFSISLFDKYKFWIFLLQKMKSPLFFLCFNECVCEGYTHARVCVCVCGKECVNVCGDKGVYVWFCGSKVYTPFHLMTLGSYYSMKVKILWHTIKQLSQRKQTNRMNHETDHL